MPGIIVLIGFSLRIYGITFGLPHPKSRPDEEFLVQKSLYFFTGDFNPNFFNYPSLTLYLTHFGHRLLSWIGQATGTWTDNLDFRISAWIDPTWVHLVPRCLSVILGTLSIYWMYLLGKQIFGRSTGLIAAFFLCLSPLHIRDSHFGLTDLPAAALVLLGLLLVLRCVDSPKKRDWFMAALVTGLATGTKYVGAFLFVPLLIACWMGHRHAGRRFLRVVFDSRIWLFGLVAVLVFLSTTPCLVTSWDRFVADLQEESHHLLAGHTPVGQRGFVHHPVVTFPVIFGWPLYGAVVLGIMTWLWPSRRHLLPLLAFVLVYFLFVARGRMVVMRYLDPILAPLLLAAADFVYNTLRALLNWCGLRRVFFRTIVYCLAIFLFVAPGLSDTGRFLRLLNREDSRVSAAKWVAQHVPEKASVLQLPAPWSALNLVIEPSQLAVDLKDYFTDVKPSDLNKRIEEIYRRRQLKHVSVYSYDRETRTFRQRQRDIVDFPDFVILQTAPGQSAPDWSHEQLLLANLGYREVWSLVADPGTDPRRFFELQDHFYLPLQGNLSIRQPGPNIIVLQRKPS